MIGVTLAVVLGAVLVGGAVILAFVGMARRGAAGHVPRTEAAEAEHHVGYLVPHGQDPAVVRTALHEAGYDSAGRVEPEGEVLTIVLHDGTPADLERVREVLSHARATNIDGPPVLDVTPVHFRDERL